MDGQWGEYFKKGMIVAGAMEKLTRWKKHLVV